ncbi:MAG: SPFH domain-containing protein [Pseudomonadota bacterium]
MGLWDTIKPHVGAQFLDVIQWLDDSRDTLVYRFPIFNQAIQDGGRLVVREGQAAIFVAEGRFSECFGPGTYELSTRTKAIWSFFESIKYGLNYPYKGDIYFVNTRQFPEQKWGTPQPIAVRDPEFGSIQIRAFGTYQYRITDPPKFLREVVGTDGLFTTDEINGQLKRKVLSVFASLLRDAKIPFDMLVGAGLELAEALKEKITPIFQESYGLAVTDFTVDGVTLPEKVQEYYEKRQGMGILGDLNAYTRLQQADAIGDAARNPGIGGAGVGMGVGWAMGQQMGQAMGNPQGGGMFNPHQGLQGGGAPPPPPPGIAKLHYHGDAGQGEYTAQEIAQLVAKNRTGTHHVWAQGWPGWKPAMEVPEIARAIPPAPPPPPPASSQPFHYMGVGEQPEQLVAPEIAKRIAANPGGRHLVWRLELGGWKPANEVPEIAALLAAAPPPPPGFPPPPPV